MSAGQIGEQHPAFVAESNPIARSWRRLAAELEYAQSFLALVDGMTFDRHGERGLNKSEGGALVSH